MDTTDATRVRADAQRNRERLVETARAAFLGAEGTVSLEQVARDAGVGIGTLYRHFPTRDDLVEAVYRNELDTVLARADELLERHQPADAMNAWVHSYAEFVTTKRGMAESLRALFQSGTIRPSQTRERVTATIQKLLDAGVAAGTLRDDVRAEDIAASLVGVFLATPNPEQREQADRMLSLLFAGVAK